MLSRLDFAAPYGWGAILSVSSVGHIRTSLNRCPDLAAVGAVADQGDDGDLEFGHQLVEAQTTSAALGPGSRRRVGRIAERR